MCLSPHFAGKTRAKSKSNRQLKVVVVKKEYFNGSTKRKQPSSIRIINIIIKMTEKEKRGAKQRKSKTTEEALEKVLLSAV